MELVFVTNNPNKLNEIQSLVSQEIFIKSLKDIDFHNEIDETELTLEGNALLKARHIHSKFGLDCFADDTGLEIEALDGAPGVFSARYAGKECIAQNNINKVLYELKDNKNRSARFITIIALIINGKEFIFKGECVGEITINQTGSDGFGYDPIFMPNSSKLTFAEMGNDEKGKISHRGIAVRKLVDFLIKKNINK
ncbi:RdgB/HAM1 family non-canonical purine NTP pyrophosphatase [Flavobacteriales bacterium]|nr:RdgB/HAM1 family non-canonical purine NTP pyrophosphatase [Flavobacteriales bacterium]